MCVGCPVVWDVSCHSPPSKSELSCQLSVIGEIKHQTITQHGLLLVVVIIIVTLAYVCLLFIVVGKRHSTQY